MAQQVQVAQAGAHPLPSRLEGQCATGLRVAAERTVHRHQAVAQQPVARLALVGPQHAGHRVAGHARRQRHRRARIVAVGEAVGTAPVFVEQAAVAQVGDAGAAQLAQA